MAKALDGILVIENTANESGPMAGQALAMLGATVIKIERPLPGGDRINKVVQDRRIGFIMRNGNKKCITLDLKSDEGKALAWKLIDKADVFLENMGPHKVDKLGFSYEEMKKRNPRIIYGRLKGFAEGSKWGECPAYDSVGNAMGGGMYMTGEAGGEPILFGPNVIDSGSGFFLAMGIITALFQREKTGVGQLVDSPMQNAMIAFCRNGFEVTQTPGRMCFKRCGNGYPGPRPTAPHQAYRTKNIGGDPDGDYFFLAASDKSMPKIFDLIGHPELKEDERFKTGAARYKNIDALNEYLEPYMASKSKYELMEEFSLKNKLSSAACATTDEIIKDEFLHELGIMQDVYDPEYGVIRTPSLPFLMEDTKVECVAPKYTGGDNDEVFLDILGLSEEEYNALYEKNVI